MSVIERQCAQAISCSSSNIISMDEILLDCKQRIRCISFLKLKGSKQPEDHLPTGRTSHVTQNSYTILRLRSTDHGKHGGYWLYMWALSVMQIRHRFTRRLATDYRKQICRNNTKIK